MTGSLAQVITIVSFGNEYLRTGILNDFYPQNSSFQFNNLIDFREIKKSFFWGGKKEFVVADDPVSWFKFLRQNGCKKLRLQFRPSNDQSMGKDHQLAGFVGGGGTWLIETIFDSYSDFWANRWEVTNPNAKDRTIWSITYGKAILKGRIINVQYNSFEIRDQLQKTLAEIANFAFIQGYTGWGETFEKALKILTSQNPESDYYRTDLISKDNYDLINRQIIFSACASFVFGGMGSWNDVWFKDKAAKEIYENLSAELYNLINKAIISGVNGDKAEKNSRLDVN